MIEEKSGASFTFGQEKQAIRQTSNTLRNTMGTTHKLVFEDARQMSLTPKSVDLVVTSPPYPMIQMWDELFSEQNPCILQTLKSGDENATFELMHCELDKVWRALYATLKEGGIACINIGDATRSLGKVFRLYPNHARVLSACTKIGFHVLPGVLWQKQSNKPNKFMGSGMLPVGAYLTLEHEHILVLRKGSPRTFKTLTEKMSRQKSAFFWEERNIWFSDVWTGLKGDRQDLNRRGLRSRSAAFPFELAYRLINMFSVQGDVVLDPYLGTGTTTLAAMATGRNSIGIEIDPLFQEVIRQRTEGFVNFANDYTQRRLAQHILFTKTREMGYSNENYHFSVMTKQEKKIQFPVLQKLTAKDDHFVVDYF
jgi:DNA modification methylase